MIQKLKTYPWETRVQDQPVFADLRKVTKRIRVWLVMDIVLILAAGAVGLHGAGLSPAIALVGGGLFALTWAGGYLTGRNDIFVDKEGR